MSDLLSTWLGAPPNSWKKKERKQMKNIQTCYKVAYFRKGRNLAFDSSLSEDILLNSVKPGNSMVSENMGRHENQEGERSIVHSNIEVREVDTQYLSIIEAHDGGDLEDFLPEDSPLRSKNSELKSPMNVKFKDYEGFVHSLSFGYWQHHFHKQTSDRVMGEIARGIVSKICTDQSRKHLRSHNGYVPFRKPREQITPLALMLHEFKVWCVASLRNLDPFDEESFAEIKRRTLYTDELRHREVWGKHVSDYGQGLRRAAHDKLFRFLTSTREELVRAEQYCFRQFCSRSSREKLRKVSSYLKKLICDESRVISGMFDLDHKLQDPRANLLQPLLLLNKAESLAHIDFKNFINVLLYKLFENPFVRACLLADFEILGDDEIESYLESWPDLNLFYNDTMATPVLFLDQQKGARVMPMIYRSAANEIRTLVRSVDSSTPIPDPPRRIVKRLKASLLDDLAVKSILECVIGFLGALQDMFPAVFALHKLHTLAGEGGDFTIYDSMKKYVISVMDDCHKRTLRLKGASATLRKLFLKLASQREELIKKQNLRKKKMIATPIWVANQRMITNEFSRVSSQSYKKISKKLRDIAQDAEEYTLSADLLSEHVNKAKKMLSLITGPVAEEKSKSANFVREVNVGDMFDEDYLVPTSTELADLTNIGKIKSKEVFALSLYDDDEDDESYHPEF